MSLHGETKGKNLGPKATKEQLGSLTAELGSLQSGGGASSAAAALSKLGGWKGLADLLAVDTDTGLPGDATTRVTRQALYGENRLPEVPTATLWDHFVVILGSF